MHCLCLPFNILYKRIGRRLDFVDIDFDGSYIVALSLMVDDDDDIPVNVVDFRRRDDGRRSTQFEDGNHTASGCHSLTAFFPIQYPSFG